MEIHEVADISHDGWVGEAKLYELGENIWFPEYDDEPGYWVSHVIVSAIPNTPETNEPETLIFPSDVNGDVMSWIEICSIQGKASIDDSLHVLKNLYSPSTKIH